MENIIKPIERFNFSKIKKVLEVPDLLEVQKKSYAEFLQMDKDPSEREDKGLEAVFKEVFPITDFNEMSVLEYVSYSIESPKYTPREALDRNTTYAAPLKVRVRLVNYDIDENTGEKFVVSAKESDVYLCDIPLMTERGTFVINGVERVIVNQLHRSPGIFFEDTTADKSVVEKHLYSARIIPYRGSWIDFEFDNKDVMHVRIDKKRKIIVTTLLKALGYTDKDILEAFYETEKVFINDEGMFIEFDPEKVLGRRFSLDIKDEFGEIIVKANHKITKAARRRLVNAGIKFIPVTFDDISDTFIAEDIINEDGEIIAEVNQKITEELLDQIKAEGINEFETLYIDRSTYDSVIRDILEIDKTSNREEALLEIYKKMRPGEPASIETAEAFFENLFFNPKRYDLSKVGRLKINKRLGLDLPLEHTVLTKEDILETVKTLDKIRRGLDTIDDIDHLGHRRVRAVGEQLQNFIRIGLTRMEKTVRERMSIQDVDELTPQDLLNAKPLSATIKEFFGSYQLSQFMDQTNPLSEITHKRRLSALGPGGLNRERAGFEVRDVHTSHYGRICPIETPEGPNIGLITSLTTYARVNEFGFIETPYRKVVDGKVTDEVVYLSAIEEEEYYIAQANAPLNEDGTFVREYVAARHKGEFVTVPASSIQYMDVAPMQIVSVSSSLIPFLEHDDANRALMGSNMQRQAVPLVRTDAPIVGTGMERKVAVDSGAVVVAKNAGIVEYVDARKIVIRYEKGDNDFGIDTYELIKYKRSNQDTCINYKPIVKKGQYVDKGQVIADGPATDRGDLALGRNVVVAFMPWMGYNYEDSILVNERLVKEDAFTSIHVEIFEIEARDTKLGPEEITRDIPNVSDEALKDLDESGIIRIGAYVKEGDILVGKVTPKGESQTTPEEKLLRAIFGEKAGDVKDASLRVPPGIRGTVIDVQVLTRRGVEKDERTELIESSEYEAIKRDYEQEVAIIEEGRKQKIIKLLTGKKLIEDFVGDDITLKEGTILTEDILKSLDYTSLSMLPIENKAEFDEKLSQLNLIYFDRIKRAEEKFKDRKKKIEKGDELPAGVLKQVRVYVAIKRKLMVGDKMAGRHGNKGVISRILPEEDMPYLPDGTPVDIVLNPLGVPSRMNVGQILETHLGIAAKALGLYIATPVFDGAKESDIKEMLRKAGLQEDGQTVLYDGRTGEPFDQEVTVGVMYMLKLHHLVETKIHARSTGPYSLVTQQPLGGKAQFGGQRLGEMEVWALEGYGAAYLLQEMLTVKSDDVEGRTKVYEAIVNGNYSYKPGLPESFNVLIKELQGLALDVELIKSEDLEKESNE
ncbi:DNA-directed RNA polymerase subunit beta [Deferribacter autotrophicus]|uniref:DNA-directed RNA polymerase subunit beta n=1 Tax=Deferribacter autotrophicus TaxID=500465 RepID=A0A5A8F5U3_9BACT|nr:DNA-directed RNA polymerase subunit beta [Deferribacter autotrophicus]KAA0258480.1 DNA-directed RNA polymerase subunit beta [Deferribacter autotrophicus]